MNSFSAAPEPESQRIFSFYPQRRTPSRSGRRKATTASLISEKGELRHRAGLLGTPVGRATQNSVGRENHFTAEGPQLEKRRTCMFFASKSACGMGKAAVPPLWLWGENSQKGSLQEENRGAFKAPGPLLITPWLLCGGCPGPGQHAPWLVPWG